MRRKKEGRKKRTDERALGKGNVALIAVKVAGNWNGVLYVWGEQGKREGERKTGK
jgi:hypothetical protein